MIPALPAYGLASVAALSAVAAFLVLVGGATFPAGMTRVPMAYVLPPLLGLAVFQLAFSTLSGRWRGAGFWLRAVPFVGLPWGIAVYGILVGSFAPGPGLAAVALIVTAGGALALRRTHR